MNEAQQYKKDYILFCYKGMIFGLIGIIIVLIISMFIGCGGNTSKKLCNSLKDLNKDYEKVYSVALTIKEADPNIIPEDFTNFIDSATTTKDVLLMFENYVCGLE